jgi:hypothetical protein
MDAWTRIASIFSAASGLEVGSALRFSRFVKKLLSTRCSCVCSDIGRIRGAIFGANVARGEGGEDLGFIAEEGGGMEVKEHAVVV